MFLPACNISSPSQVIPERSGSASCIVYARVVIESYFREHSDGEIISSGGLFSRCFLFRDDLIMSVRGLYWSWVKCEGWVEWANFIQPLFSLLPTLYAHARSF